MLLEFIESNKTILCATPVVTEEDQIIRYVKCDFHFTSALWLNMITIRAVFKSASYGTSEEVILDSSNSCLMPVEVYRHGGVIQVALYGDYIASNANARTSYIGPVNVFFGKNPRLPVPIPSKYDVFVAEYTNILARNNALVSEMTRLLDEFADIESITWTDDMRLVITLTNGDVYVSPDTLKGLQGERGEQGPTGATGAAGPAGSKGDKGDPGEPGPTGKTAYQYAVDGGYTGTESQFSAKLAEESVTSWNGQSGDITFTETDPTVPSWAKSANKPSYTANEVGALPDDLESGVSYEATQAGFAVLTLGNAETDSDKKTGVLKFYGLSSGLVNFYAPVTTGVYTISLPSDTGTVALTKNIPTKTSQLTNDSGFLRSYTETDPTVPAWAKASMKPSYTASEVGALPDTTTIPANTSDLTNDSGFITLADLPVYSGGVS